MLTKGKIMLITLVVLLVVLWFLGYIHLPAIPNFALFVMNGHTISLWDLLTFLVIAWIIGILPGPFRYIGVALLLLWLMALFGVIALTGLSNILLIAIIVGLIAYLLGGTRSV